MVIERNMSYEDLNINTLTKKCGPDPQNTFGGLDLIIHLIFIEHTFNSNAKFSFFSDYKYGIFERLM